MILYYDLAEIVEKPNSAKDINIASGTNLLALAKTLGCSIEALIEHNV